MFLVCFVSMDCA